MAVHTTNPAARWCPIAQRSRLLHCHRPAGSLCGASARFGAAPLSYTCARRAPTAAAAAHPRGPGSSDAAQHASESQPQQWEVLGDSSAGDRGAEQGGAEPQAAPAGLHRPTCACCRPGGGGGPIRHVITYVDAVVLEVESADGSVMYLDEEDQVEGAAGTWAASGWAGATAAESGLVVEAEVVSVPTGAEAAQYIVFEGDEENEEEEEKEEKGREGAGRDAGAARAGRFVFVPDVEPRSPGRSGPRRAS